MGCSSSNATAEKNHESQKIHLSETIRKEWKIYSETNNKIENLLNDINSKFRDDFYTLMDSVLYEETFYTRYQKLLEKEGLAPKDIMNYILDIELIEEMCKENYQDYEIHNIVL